jgi:hypothetical protein
MTPYMRRHLNLLLDGKWHTAYELKGDLRTLSIMAEYEWVQCHKDKGHEQLPRHAIYWRITDKGRRELMT